MNTWTEAQNLRVGDQVVSIQGDPRGYDDITYKDTDPGDRFIWVKVEGIYGKGTYRLGQYEQVLIGPRPDNSGTVDEIVSLLDEHPNW
jgi:hypothetical protein